LPNLDILQARAEELSFHDAFGFVTGRAVAPLAVQLEVSAPWCSLGGLVVPFRTPNESFDFNAKHLGLVLETVEERALPHTDVVRSFPLYRKIKPTPPQYPRTWAQIKKRPLQ
jgi:16S rRNA (guanine527-N7)-methyltransferase